MTKQSSTKSTPNSGTLQSSPRSLNSAENHTTVAEDAVSASKPKRVRTGCLTCRERHLKCDEGAPICQNCKKSNRKCKRGLRLNYIDITCERPPYLLPPTHDWKVTFLDESREIASEYRGGLDKYHALEPEPKRQRIEIQDMAYDYGTIAAPVMSHQQLPGPPAPYQNFTENPTSVFNPAGNQAYIDPTQQMQNYAEQAQGVRQTYNSGGMLEQQDEETGTPLQDQTEVLYMQVFVEEVGLWMDSMDADKHFSRMIPHQALREPMLKYALLACGVRHLTLINPAVYPEEHALKYYNSATQLLLKLLQNPERDSFLCATTATILNIYEVMNEKALQRMNHLAGARALIKECRWDATSTGIGAACFWLNIGLELFSCMHFNWSTSWDPDTWGIDMAMSPQHIGGNEADWCHKILWVLAKVTNFRSSEPRFKEQSLQAEQMRVHSRHQQWLGLKQFCDKWLHCIPPTMHPIANVPTYMTRSKSAFPEVWYVKRATVVARLFYHTAMTLLGSVHPLARHDKATADDMHNQTTYHSQQICGIVAHVKDRGVASASIRCLAAAGEVLTVRREQDETLEIFTRINKETGWRIQFIIDELKEKWGWTNQEFDGMGAPSFYQQGGGGTASIPPIPTRPKPPSGIPNPLYKNADFGAANPPYQGFYVPPTQGHLLHSTQLYGFSGISSI